MVKAHIDAKRCRGHARCLTIAPEAFEFIDDEDRAAVNHRGVARTNVALLLEAEEECPERAITVGTGTEGEDG
jgi:ferredoxin